MPKYRLLYAETFAALYDVEAPDEDTAQQMVDDWDGDDSVVPVDKHGRLLSEDGCLERTEVCHCETEQVGQ